MAKSLKDFAGEEAIYLDANIFLHHAFGTKLGAADFLQRLESSSLKVTTSILALEEVTFKLIVQSCSNELPRPTILDVRRLMENAGRRKKILQPVLDYLGYFEKLTALGLKVLDVSPGDREPAREFIWKYGLLPADALHLAVMRRKKIRNLATADDDFGAVREITVWKP